MKQNFGLNARSFFRMAGLQLLTLALIVAMTSPALAVVFTNAAAITINDAAAQGVASAYPSNVTVSGMTGAVTSVTLTLSNLNHSFPDDLDLLLVAPGGNNLVVMSDAGGTADVFNLGITFSDAAPAAITDGGPLGGGTFQVSQYVAGDVFPAPAPAASANTTFAAAFNGIDPNGTWSLFAVDDTGVDMGTLGNGWFLTVTTAGTPATSFANPTPTFLNDRFGSAGPYPSAIVASGLTGAITDINVTLTNLNHLNPDDLEIFLVGPTGKRIMLMSDAGGTADVVNATITLDDAAATQIPDAGPIVTGTFRPANFGTGDTIANFLPPYPSASSAGTATLGSVFNGTDGNGTWSLYITDDATGSTGSVAGGWSIDIIAGGTYGAKRFTSSDFSGDGLSDVGIIRPSNYFWWIRNSPHLQNSAVQWGTTGDIPVPSDYDGDRKSDYAVFRPSNGHWIVLNSGSSTVTFTPWGANGDTPVPQDYDGDGKFDVAIWRTGTFWVRNSSNGATRAVQWGAASDLPVRGHFAGSNFADFVVFRPSTGVWHILENESGSIRQQQWGLGSDELVPADYDGDGRTDIAVWRPSNGTYYIFNSGTSTVGSHTLGVTGDTPVPADYDGDSRADLAVWRGSEGGWYIYNSGTVFGAAALRQDSWGGTPDIPTVSTYFP
jgi:subtilisin-like proprotein convertase family protein